MGEGFLRTKVMSTQKPTVVVAMSGGVDSSVAAGLLLHQGYNVLGITMQIWQESTTQTKGAGCCSLGAVEDARRVAAKLGIPHYVLNFREFFAEKVIDNFVSEYKRGRTRIPASIATVTFKFDALLAKAQALGAEYLATGHYARVEFNEDWRRWTLRRALDDAKDQTYALYHFTQNELAHTLMPLGQVTNKAETRAIAGELGLAWRTSRTRRRSASYKADPTPTSSRRMRRRPSSPAISWIRQADAGGAHDGIAFYTIGQRKRVNVGSPIPLYVIGIDAESNTVVVGGNEDLMARSLVADDINWVGLPGLEESRTVMAKIRYNMEAAPATVEPGNSAGEIILHFDTPQRAVSPGQSLVMYDGDSVLGGASIQRRL